MTARPAPAYELRRLGREIHTRIALIEPRSTFFRGGWQIIILAALFVRARPSRCTRTGALLGGRIKGTVDKETGNPFGQFWRRSLGR
jgi:hypothetical protein